MAGGLYGLNVFNPDEMRYNKVLSKVMFSSLYLFDKEVKTGEKYDGRVILPGDLNRFRKIELDYDQNIFTVEFASDNFNLPDKTTYQYNLKGLGDGWLVLPAGINRVTFTSLAPGTYTLNVKATNSDGYEGTDVAPPDDCGASSFLACVVGMAVLCVRFCVAAVSCPQAYPTKGTRKVSYAADRT